MGYISNDILLTSLVGTVGVGPVLIHVPKRVFINCCASGSRGGVGFLRAAVVKSIGLSSFFPSRGLSSAVINGSRGRVSGLACRGSGRCTAEGCQRGSSLVRSNGIGCVFLRVSGGAHTRIRPVNGWVYYVSVRLACVCRDKFTLSNSNFAMVVSCCHSSRSKRTRTSLGQLVSKAFDGRRTKVPRKAMRDRLLQEPKGLCILTDRFRPSRFGGRMLR